MKRKILSITGIFLFLMILCNATYIESASYLPIFSNAPQWGGQAWKITMTVSDMGSESLIASPETPQTVKTYSSDGITTIKNSFMLEAKLTETSCNYQLNKRSADIVGNTIFKVRESSSPTIWGIPCGSLFADCVNYEGHTIPRAFESWAKSNCNVRDGNGKIILRMWYADLAAYGKVYCPNTDAGLSYGVIGDFDEKFTDFKVSFNVCVPAVGGCDKNILTKEELSRSGNLAANVGTHTKVEWLGNLDTSKYCAEYSIVMGLLQSNGKWKIIKSGNVYSNWNSNTFYNLKSCYETFSSGSGTICTNEFNNRANSAQTTDTSGFSNQGVYDGGKLTTLGGIMTFAKTQQHLINPRFVLLLDPRITWVGVYKPSGVPAIIGQSACALKETLPSQIWFDVKNVGDTLGSFTATLVCDAPISKTLTDGFSLSAGQTRRTYFTLNTEEITSNQVNKLCKFTVKETTSTESKTANMYCSIENRDHCTSGEKVCFSNVLKQCQNDAFIIIDDCVKRNAVCDSALLKCVEKGVCAKEGETCDSRSCCENLECTGGLLGAIGKTCQKPLFSIPWHLVILFLLILLSTVLFYAMKKTLEWALVGLIFGSIVASILYLVIEIIAKQWFLILLGGAIGLYIFYAVGGFVMLIMILSIVQFAFAAKAKK